MAWCSVREVRDQWRTAGLVQEHVDRRFRDEGIIVAFPQRSVSHLGDGGEGRVEQAPRGPSPTLS